MSVYHVADIVLSTRHIAIKKKADIIILKKKNLKKKRQTKISLSIWSLHFVDRIESINKQVKQCLK